MKRAKALFSCPKCGEAAMITDVWFIKEDDEHYYIAIDALCPQCLYKIKGELYSLSDIVHIIDENALEAEEMAEA